MSRAVEKIEYEQMLLSRHANSSHKKHAGLGRSTYLILSCVEAHGPMTIAELSEALGLDVSTLQRQTSAAMKDGVLNRIPDPDGGIARKFVASHEGQEMLLAERGRFVRALEVALSDWSEPELADFARALKRFNQSIEKAGALSWAPH